MKKTVTLENVILFRLNAERYINQQYPKDTDPKKESEKKDQIKKFKYALEKMMSRTNDIDKKYQDYQTDIRVDNASEDDRKNLLMNAQGQFSFTREAHKTLNELIRKKQLETVEVEVYPAPVSSVPEDLTVTLREIFTPFVLEEETKDLYTQKTIDSNETEPKP